MFKQDFTCPALLKAYPARLPVRGSHPLRPLFPKRSSSHKTGTGLVRVRSPLLTESRLMSFPPGTEMFQFPGFASHDYVFITGYRLRGGFPHSDIHGSKPARGSPWLFAACHVLHRLLAPRHPPDALHTLDPNHPSQPNSTKAPDKIPRCVCSESNLECFHNRIKSQVSPKVTQGAGRFYSAQKQ
jgi:hypothetical protein